MAAAGRILEALDAQPEYIPRRPALLPQLLTAVRMTALRCETLPASSAKTPRLPAICCASPTARLYRGTGKPVESIDRATILVGTQGIRSIIATALLQP
jgi:hypothetical protein